MQCNNEIKQQVAFKSFNFQRASLKDTEVNRILEKEFVKLVVKVTKDN